MTISEIVNKFKDVCFGHEEVKTFNIGNTWDQATGKGDVYPNVWLELPVLINYTIQKNNVKSFTFSFDVLMIPENDNVLEELNTISKCEVIGDELIASLRLEKEMSLTTNPTGLSIKNINADLACGVRYDIVITTGRQC